MLLSECSVSMLQARWIWSLRPSTRCESSLDFELIHLERRLLIPVLKDVSRNPSHPSLLHTSVSPCDPGMFWIQTACLVFVEKRPFCEYRICSYSSHQKNQLVLNFNFIGFDHWNVTKIVLSVLKILNDAFSSLFTYDDFLVGEDKLQVILMCFSPFISFLKLVT